MTDHSAFDLNQRVGQGEFGQVAAVAAAMLPLVNVVGRDRGLADQAVQPAFATIAEVFDLSGGDVAMKPGHVVIVEEVAARLNDRAQAPRFAGISISADTRRRR